MYLEKLKAFFKKLNFKDFVMIFLLLFGIVPIIPRAVSTYLTTYFYMAIVVTVVLFTLITCRLARVKQLILLLLPFIIYETIVLLTKQDSDILLSGYQVLLFLLPVCVGFYLVSNAFFNELYSSVIVIAFFVTGITTTVGCMTYPDAARILASTETSQDPIAVMYSWMNIGGYGFVYSMVLLYPFVVLAFKMKRLRLIPMVILTVMMFTTALAAEYTYAFMLLMISTMMLLLPRDISVKRFITLIIVFAVAVFLFRTTIAMIVTALGNYLGNSTMVDKINAIFLGKDAVEGFDDDRSALYMLSIESFLKNPLFGSLPSGNALTGGHSFILDNLARFGLVGGGLMIFMYRGIWRVFFRPLKDQPGYCLVFWAFVQPILLSSINTGMWLENLCLYPPILLCYIYGNEFYLKQSETKPTPLVQVNVLQSKVTKE